MTDESASVEPDLERFGLTAFNPYDLYDEEAERVIATLSTWGEGDVRWNQPSRCPGWAARDVLAHLLWSERYNEASLRGTVADFLADLGSKGVTTLDAANEMGVDELRPISPRELLDTWKRTLTDHRARFRARGDGLVDTSVGQYSARLQVFHLTAELATHADDMHLPVADADRAARQHWRTAVARLALSEIKPELAIEVDGTRTRVSGNGVVVEAGEDDFVEGVTGHLDESSGFDADARALLKI